jgi:hypothetical protein
MHKTFEGRFDDYRTRGAIQRGAFKLISNIRITFLLPNDKKRSEYFNKSVEEMIEKGAHITVNDVGVTLERYDKGSISTVGGVVTYPWHVIMAFI